MIHSYPLLGEHTEKILICAEAGYHNKPVNVQEARMKEDPLLESSTYFRTK